VADDPLPELRASDADRERTAELLRRAAGEGRLDVDELEERLSSVYATRTQRELDKLVADVVVPEDRNHAPRLPVRRGDGGTRWLVSIMSGHDRKGRWRVGTNLNVVNVMGGSDIDFNDAELADDIVTVTVFSLMGGASIRVPEGINVEISDFAFMGGNDASIGNPLPDPGGPTLRIKLISIMGGSDVKRGRRLSKAERRELRRGRLH
jgi:uncharacterized protein DUF1707